MLQLTGSSLVQGLSREQIQANQDWRAGIQKQELHAFLAQHLHAMSACTTAYFPCSTSSTLQSRDIREIKEKLPDCNHLEFECDSGESSFNPYSIVSGLTRDELANITTLTFRNVNGLSSEIISHLGLYAQNLHTLTVVNGMHLNRDFFADLFFVNKDWQSLTFIGKGEINNDVLAVFSVKQPQLQFLKLAATKMRITEDECRDFKDRHPNLHLELLQLEDEKAISQTTTSKKTPIVVAPAQRQKSLSKILARYLNVFKKHHD